MRPGDAARSSTRPTTTPTATSLSLDPATGKPAHADPRTRGSARSCSTAATGRSGASAHLNGIATLVAHPAAVRRLDVGPRLAVRRGRSTTSTSRPTASSSRRPSATSSGRQQLAARHEGRSRCSKGDATPVATFDFGTRDPVELRLLRPTAGYLYGSSYYTGVSNIFRYELATGKLEAVSNAETGFFRPIPLGDDELDRVPLHGPGLRARAHRGEAARGREPDHVPRPADRREAPGRQGLEARLAGRRPARLARRRGAGRLPLRGASGLESVYPVVAGLQGLRRRRRCARTSPTPCMLNRASLTASYTPDGDLPAERALPRRRPSSSATTGRSAFQLNGGRLLRPRRPDAHEPQGLRGRRRLQPHARLRPAAAARPQGRRHVLRQPRPRCPTTRTSPTNFTDELATRARLRYRNLPPLARLRRRGEGRRLGPRLRRRPREGRRLPAALRQPRPRHGAPARATRRCGCAPRPAASPGDRATSRSRTSTSAASATTGSTGATRSATASRTRFPGLEINEVGGTQLRAGRCSSGTCRPVRFRRVGKPGFYLTWARPALFAIDPRRRTWTTRRAAPRRSRTSAARSTSASACCRGSS